MESGLAPESKHLLQSGTFGSSRRRDVAVGDVEAAGIAHDEILEMGGQLRDGALVSDLGGGKVQLREGSLIERRRVLHRLTGYVQKHP